MDADKLISLVYEHPELWDQNHSSYSNRQIKVKLWGEVGKELSVLDSEAKTKWTSLRDIFRREVKKNQTDNYQSKWTYFRSMQFLKEHLNQKPGIVLKKESVSGTQNYIIEEDPDENNQNTFDEYGKTIKSDQEDLQSPDEKHGVALNQEKPVQKRTRSSMGHQSLESKASSTQLKKPRLIEEDEDYYFLMSILPSLRHVTKTRKNMLKLNILKLICDEEQSSS